MRRQIQIPYANARSFDTEPKALVSYGILRRGMLDGGHVWPSLPGGAEGYQDARWQASALRVLPFHAYRPRAAMLHASAIEEIASSLICLRFPASRRPR